MAPDRLKVLWLIKGLGPGGAEHLLRSFAERTDATDIEYHCAYVVAAKDQLVPALEDAGVVVHHLPGRWWPLGLRRLVAAEGFDVVHAQSPLLAVAARLVLRHDQVRRPALVSTEHNVPEAYHRVTRRLYEATYPLDDRHLAVSLGAVRSAPPRHRDEVEVVVHGVALDRVRAQRDRAGVRAELGFDRAEVVVGTVANYRVQKAWPDLLAAARLVLDRCPMARFVGVGQGPLEADVRAEHARLGLGDRFLLLGERADAVRVLSGCDVFCLSSVQEGLPVALMEALALGLPVVATAVGGIPEAVTDGVEGLLVAPRRPAALAEALIAMVADPDRRAGAASAAVVRGEAFDIGRAVERTETIYRELAGR